MCLGFDFFLIGPLKGYFLLNGFASVAGCSYPGTNRLGVPSVSFFSPRRWVVERTFPWFSNYRRLSKEYEVLPETTESMLYAAMVHVMVRRLARQAVS